MGSSIQVDPPLSMLMADARPDRPRVRSRIAALAGAAAVTLVLHWMVLGGGRPTKRPAPRAVEPVTVRTLEPPAPVMPAITVAPAAVSVAKRRLRPAPRPPAVADAVPVDAA